LTKKTPVNYLHPHNSRINKTPKSKIPTKLKKVPRWRATSLFQFSFSFDSLAQSKLAREKRNQKKAFKCLGTPVCLTPMNLFLLFYIFGEE